MFVIFERTAIFIILQYMLITHADVLCLQLHTIGPRFSFGILRISFDPPFYNAVRSSICIPKIIVVYSEDLLKLKNSLSLSLCLSERTVELVNIKPGATFDFLPLAQQPLLGECLRIIEASRSHSDTPHSVGLL
jgi:hypothetical protein